MKALTKTALAMVAAACMGANAFALTITPLSAPQWNGALTGQINPLSAAQVETIVGLAAGSLTEVYKSDVNKNDLTGLGVDSGAFAGSYVTTFSNPANDPADALIDYISGDSISGTPIYLGVKDGNTSPYWYVFDISTWNGTEDINLDGFWEGVGAANRGAISHVSIFTGGTNVPDGGSTLALVGLAAIGLSLLRRKLA